MTIDADRKGLVLPSFRFTFVELAGSSSSYTAEQKEIIKAIYRYGYNVAKTDPDAQLLDSLSLELVKDNRTYYNISRRSVFNRKLVDLLNHQGVIVPSDVLPIQNQWKSTIKEASDALVGAL